MVLIGPRQVGKTTLLMQMADRLLDEGWPPGNLTYFDFSDDRLPKAISPRAVTDLNPPGRRADWSQVFLLDEIQEAVNWQRWLKAAVDTARRTDEKARPIFILTGSAAGQLRAGGIESGQGRWDEIDIEGLTYAEFLLLGAGPGETAEDVVSREPGAFRRYLLVGGFPEHARLDGRPDPLSRIRQDVVERAILRDLRREGVDLDRVKRLFLYLVTGSGNIWNAEERAKDLDNTNPKSVKEWLALLEQARLLWRLDRDLRSRAKASETLRPRPKLYAADHGLIAALSTSSDPTADEKSRGQLLEAATFRHLREYRRSSKARLGYFRQSDDLEIDFVVRPERGAAIALEVTGSADIDRRKLARFTAAAEGAGASRRIMIHGGIARRSEGDVTLVGAREFLLAPERFLEQAT